MATSYTFDTLKTALVDWSEDSFSDFADEIPDIIALAETRCLRELDLELFDTTDTSKSTAIGDPELDLADDGIVLRSLYVNDALVLPRAESYVNYYDGLVSTGQPLYWCQHAETSVLLAPTPDAVYSTRQRVMKRPAGLSASTTTTWLSTHAGDLLFWACMAQAESWAKTTDTGDAAVAEAEYQKLLPAARHELRLLMRRDY